MIARYALPALVGLGAGLLFHYERGLPPQLAAIAGAAVAILVFMAMRAAERLLRLWRR